MLSKTAPCFALVVTGTFSEFLACITVVFLFCWGEMVSKTALSFALVPSPNSKLVTSSFPFFCWGKMLSKTAPSFALVVTGTFSEFVACITVVFLFFSRVKWSLKLHFSLRSYLLRILSVYYRRLLFFCWGKMLSKTAPCFALVVTGTFSKFLACITVVFLFCWGEMVSKTALLFALVPYPNSKRVLSSFLFFAWVKWSL